MINRDELRVDTVAVNVAEVTVGNAIPQDMRRFIYRVKFINLVAGPNQLTIGKRENGAAGTTVVDYLQAAVVDEMITDPDDIDDDNMPLYVIDGGPSRGPTAAAPGTSIVRAVTDAGAGIFTYWYIDAPA